MKTISAALQAGIVLTASALIASTTLTEETIAQEAGSRVSELFGASDASLFQAACAACHGPDGKGRSKSELAFDVAVPDFTECVFATREPDADWYAIVHDGGPVRGFDRMMPAFGDLLNAEEAQRVLDHIRTLCTDDAWPRGELNVPKALFTEKAFPEDEALIRTNISAEGPSSLTQRFTWEKRFGPRSQVEVSLPFTRADLGAPRGKEGGAGDLSLAFKHALRHDLNRGFILSVGGEWVLPTGDETRGFGKGTTVLEPYVLYAKLLPRDSFFQFQGTLEFPIESGFEEELVIRAAFGRTWTTGGPFGRAWTPMIEVLGSREFASAADVNWDLVPQFQVTLNTRQHIMANVGFKVPATNSSVRDTELVFYLLWDWFDGGLLEGW
jgi:mono/diheme cytochrome c family protein